MKPDWPAAEIFAWAAGSSEYSSGLFLGGIAIQQLNREGLAGLFEQDVRGKGASSCDAKQFHVDLLLDGPVQTRVYAATRH